MNYYMLIKYFIDKTIKIIMPITLDIKPTFLFNNLPSNKPSKVNIKLTIEKIIPKDMVTYTTDLFDIMIAAKGKKV